MINTEYSSRFINNAVTKVLERDNVNSVCVKSILFLNDKNNIIKNIHISIIINIVELEEITAHSIDFYITGIAMCKLKYNIDLLNLYKKTINIKGKTL